MGTYIEFRSRAGAENQINEAYARMTGKPDWLVYSDAVIRAEIAYIHSPQGKGQEHMRAWLHTVEDWNKAFPAFESGTGAIKLSSVDELDQEQRDRVARDIRFILEHRLLFETVSGLDDARRFGFTEFDADLLEKGKKSHRTSQMEPTFGKLPKGKSSIYRDCVAANRPDLWVAFCAFRTQPSWENWCLLRSKMIPWHDNDTVWMRVERAATNLDGITHGLSGRFQDGNTPALLLVTSALKSVLTRVAEGVEHE